MKQVLFITPKEVRERTSLDSNVEDNKIINTIILAQDLTIEPLLGAILFDEIKKQVIDGNLETKYITLLDYYVRKVLTSTILDKITLFLIYRYNNTGTIKNAIDKQQILSKDEINTLRGEVQEYVSVYGNRLTDHLRANTELYPLYDDIEDGKTQATVVGNNTFYNG